MNRSWNYKKIGDVCIVERGGSPRPINKFITNSKDGVNWIKIGDTTESMYITQTAQKIIPEGVKKSRYVKPGDFLLSNSMSFGRPYILKIDGCIHDGWLVLRDKDNIFDKRFLYFYLSSQTTYQKFKSMAVGGVVNNLNSEMVKKIEVPTPTIQEQQKIVSTLDTLQSIITHRRTQLEKLDLLVKARFVEMFGTPESVIDSSHTIAEVADVQVGIVIKPTRYYADGKNGIRAFRSLNIGPSCIKDDDWVYFTEDAMKETQRTIVHTDDILVVRSGNPGTSCVVPTEYDGCNVIDLIIVHPNKEKVLPEYLCAFTNMPHGMNQINSQQRGAAQKHFNVGMYKKLKLILPSLDEQKQFINFLKQTDKSKATVQKALDEAQLLFDSLMQKYFG